MSSILGQDFLLLVTVARELRYRLISSGGPTQNLPFIYRNILNTFPTRLHVGHTEAATEFEYNNFPVIAAGSKTLTEKHPC